MPVSPYKRKFRDGAILYPRVLMAVEDAPATTLGAGAGRRRVRSRRSTTEKAPWKHVETILGSVETQHVYPTHLGETIAPYRALEPILSVLPLGADRLLTQSEIAEYPGLAEWWSKAEKAWEANKVANDTSDLLTRIDYHAQLSAQVPIASQRVVYTKSGNSLAAARVEDPSAVIDHVLYWSPVATVAEGRYLTGILNSSALLTRVAPLQSRGLFGARHFDKNVFYVAFGPYDSANADHVELVNLVEQAETVAAGAPIAPAFRTTRRNIRKALADAGLIEKIEAAVSRVLPVVAGAEGAAADVVGTERSGSPAVLSKTSLEPLDLEEADVEIDLDVEYDAEQAVYLWGYLVSHKGHREAEYHNVGSPKTDFDAAGLAAAALDDLRQVIAAANTAGKTVRLYHYGVTERLHVERLGDGASEVLGVSTDLLALIRSRLHSTVGYGLKDLGRLAGATWRTDGLTGQTTYDWIAEARTGDDQAWNELLMYNEDDVRATKALREYLRGNVEQPGGDTAEAG